MDNPMDNARPFVGDEPSPLMREIPEGAAYPIEALGPLREAVEAIHDMTQAPVAIGAQAVLGVAALASQAQANVETLHGSAPCSLFLLTIAGSGERKTTCDRLAMQPVLDFQRELSDIYRDEALTARNRLDIWERQRSDILKSTKKDPVAAEVDLEALGPAPEGPLSPVIIATEPTFEGITKSLSFSRPALGVYSDEGGGFIGGHAMNAENRLKTMAGFSDFWDGKPINRTRAGDGVETYPGRRLSCHLMVQPVAAAGLLSDTLANGQGFVPRFLMAAPPSAAGTRTRRGHSTSSKAGLAHFTARIGEMLRADLPLREGTRNELDLPTLGLEPDARNRLQAFLDEVERAQGRGGTYESIRPFASKAAEHAARIAGVLTVFKDGDLITGQAMGDAIKLARFYLGEALRLSDAASISVETEEAELLRKWLQNSWNEPFISATDAAQNGPRRLRETSKIRKLLRILESHGWLTLVEDGAEVSGKHRREAWRIYGR